MHVCTYIHTYVPYYDDAICVSYTTDALARFIVHFTSVLNIKFIQLPLFYYDNIIKIQFVNGNGTVRLLNSKHNKVIKLPIRIGEAAAHNRFQCMIR